MVRIAGGRGIAVCRMGVVLVLLVIVAGCPGTLVRGAVPPDASFKASPSQGSPPLRVAFADTSKAGTAPIRSWLWDFGDGTFSSEPNPTHTYLETKSYTVSLTVTTAVEPAGRTSVPGAVVVTEATTVRQIDSTGGTIEAGDARLVIPAGALDQPVIIGIAPGDGVVPVDTAGGEQLVSDVFGIALDRDSVFVGIQTPITLEIPFSEAMVPVSGRNGIKLQIVAQLENGVAIPIPGAVQEGQFVANVTGLPERASYAVAYRPDFVFENIPVDEPVLKAGSFTGYDWRTSAWRVGYTPAMLQALTALRIGTLDAQVPYDHRDFQDWQNEESLSDLRTAVREMHQLSQLTGFATPALFTSPAGEFTLVLHPMNIPVIADYQSVADVAFSTSIFGSVVIDPAQLIAISKRNTVVTAADLLVLGRMAPAGVTISEDELKQALLLDRKQEMDFPNAFSQELFRTMFRGYAYPAYSALSSTDLDLHRHPRMIPFSQGFEDGIATLTGQVLSTYHATAQGSTVQLMARSMSFNEYSAFWDPLFAPFSSMIPSYSYATQDFFFFVGRRFPEMMPGTQIPKALVFVADSYEGVLELLRVRESAPAVTGFEPAILAANEAVDIALRKTFGTDLATMYWDYARGRAYENGESNALRPTDLVRPAFTLNQDRFNDKTLFTHTFTLNNETTEISYDTVDGLRDIPPMSTRAILLSTLSATGDLVISVNAFEWLPDATGNSMRVKVYETGKDGVELDAAQSQITLSGLGATPDFRSALVLVSNVSLDRKYSLRLIATLQASTTPGATGLLGGQVTESVTGLPLADVNVVVRQRTGSVAGAVLGSTSTDSRGIFVFTQLPIGDVELTFSKSGYQTLKVNRSVVAGSPTVVQVALHLLL